MIDEQKSTKQHIDWERIEELYRTGVLSLREVARQCNVTDTAIRKRATRDGWTRDLSERVRAQVRTELVRTAVRGSEGGRQVRTERDVIQAAAATVVEVVRDHRSSIRSTRGIVAALSAQLLNAVENRAELDDTVGEETKGDKGKDRYRRLMRAIALPGHIVAAKDLAMAQKVLIGLERQAFGLGDVDDPTPADDPATSNRTTPTDEAMAKLTEFLLGAGSPG